MEVEALREDGDEEYEQCTVKALDSTTGLMTLSFPDGFLRQNVPVSTVRFLDLKQEVDPPIAPAVSVSRTKAASSDAANAAADAAADAVYAKEVGPRLPTPPSAEEQAADEDAKYAFVRAYKDVGNALFKAASYEHAIRTYCDAVDSLIKHCYESRERMLWDYFARGPCAQCYSNSALCALKLGNHEHAAVLCERAMECKPEDTDLVKVLLRHGQALLGIGGAEQAEAAKAVLERAATKEPGNRAVREELAKAKKAVSAAAREANARLFQRVDLSKDGLTSKKEHALAQLSTATEQGFHALVEGKDKRAIELLAPLLEGKAANTPHRRPTTMLALYGVGVARYHAGEMNEAIASLREFFELRAALDAEGVEYTPPLMGVPLVRFYYAHALYNSQQLRAAQEQLELYLQDVAAAGPQRILNMPAGMCYELLGRHVSDDERAASRFKARASSDEAQGDAYTMLAVIADRRDGGAAAVPLFERVVALSGSNDRQRAEAHDSLSRTHTALRNEEKAAEHALLARECRQKIADAEEEERKKKVKQIEEDAKQAADEAQQPADGVPEEELPAPDNADADAEAPPPASVQVS